MLARQSHCPHPSGDRAVRTSTSPRSEAAERNVAPEAGCRTPRAFRRTSLTPRATSYEASAGVSQIERATVRALGLVHMQSGTGGQMVVMAGGTGWVSRSDRISLTAFLLRRDAVLVLGDRAVFDRRLTDAAVTDVILGDRRQYRHGRIGWHSHDPADRQGHRLARRCHRDERLCSSAGNRHDA